MTDRPADDEASDAAAASAPDRPLDAEAETLPEKSFFALIPRRDLTKAALLLLFLIVIIALQRRSGSIVKSLTNGLYAPAPAQLQQREARPKEPPSIRLAPKTP